MTGSSIDVYAELFRRCSDRVEMARDERERVILIVGRFLTDLETGGLSGFLYNISPDSSSSQNVWSELREVVVALRRIEAANTADALEQLIPLLEARGPGGSTWGSFLEARGIDLNAHEARLEPSPQLWGHLDSFVGG
jgi:hypothetical protein